MPLRYNGRQGGALVLPPVKHQQRRLCHAPTMVDFGEGVIEQVSKGRAVSMSGDCRAVVSFDPLSF